MGTIKHHSGPSETFQNKSTKLDYYILPFIRGHGGCFGLEVVYILENTDYSDKKS